MRRGFSIALTLACCWGALLTIHAQSSPAGNGSGSPQNTTAPNGAKPASNATSSGSSSQSGANPFPTDTSSVPVIPTKAPSAVSAPPADYSNVPLPGDDIDPVRSPDDAAASSDSGQVSGFSDSTTDLDQLLKPPPDTRKHKGEGADAIPQETPKQDESVGSYYLDTKDWKGALSRFESALVLDPENPEVYWGLAEAQRHLGEYASAKANYLKVMEYDPDSRHSKDAKKILKQPEMANAPTVSTNAHTAHAPAQ